MIDRKHNDLGHKVRAVIDDALAELILLGAEGKDAAAYLMAAQAALRIEDNEQRRALEKYVSELVWDVDDTGDVR